MRNESRLKRPREPAPSECCGSGCARCVWDVYFDDLEKYEHRLRELKAQGIYMEESDEEDESGSSTDDDDDAPPNYIGSVVVKYVEGPSSQYPTITPLKAVSRILDSFASIRDVCLLLSSNSFTTDDKITNDEHSVQVIDVFLDKINKTEKGTQSEIPSPGDVVEIFIPNDSDENNSGHFGEVEEVCGRLGINPDQWCEIHKSPFVPENHFPPWLPLQCRIQIRTLLAYFVDISSCSYLLRPVFFQTLLRAASVNKTNQISSTTGNENIGSMKLLETCASDETAPFIYKTIMNGGNAFCYPRLNDMLSVFPFAKIPIARLLEVSGPLRPRKFSVVHHTLCKNNSEEQLNSVQLCLRRVDVNRINPNDSWSEKDTAAHVLAKLLRDAASSRYTTHSEETHFFRGHVSYPLCNFRSQPRSVPMYVGTRLFGTGKFTEGLKGALLPFTSQRTLLKKPYPLLILVGAGTGIGPMMSAVHELLRYRYNNACSELTKPNCWVVYGARNSSELLFHRELQEALKLNAISRYDVALSRQNEGGYHKYVTDVLESHSEELRSELLEKGARLFACGPVAVLKSLRQRLMHHILVSKGDDDDESVREQRVLLLERKGQLVFDIWGTVNIFE
ncbi:putative oxidoreductase [Trypanosoma theileri]|uniref:Putative oxidoreductase n=1 Tax=Trypanosoma theileri TaxID=67003 RepID=A0A1X0P608_9TRYP|nr:putative oxidoreductase [Trypanosoma theileri]ORC92362.1 putative oxidoreductase [Trypanosoma theileri]